VTSACLKPIPKRFWYEPTLLHVPMLTVISKEGHECIRFTNFRYRLPMRRNRSVCSSMIPSISARCRLVVLWVTGAAARSISGLDRRRTDVLSTRGVPQLVLSCLLDESARRSQSSALSLSTTTRTPPLDPHPRIRMTMGRTHRGAGGAMGGVMRSSVQGRSTSCSYPTGGEKTYLVSRLGLAHALIKNTSHVCFCQIGYVTYPEPVAEVVVRIRV
jgi:hypothetical protein